MLYLGLGQLRGKHADVLSARRDFSAVRFDLAGPMLTLTRDLHAIPRRPPPDF